MAGDPTGPPEPARPPHAVPPPVPGGRGGDRRERWRAATTEITAVLLGEVRRTEALRLVARRAREVAEAALVLLLLYEDESGLLTVEVGDGEDDGAVAALVGVALPAEETGFADAVTAAGHLVLEDLGTAAQWPVPISTGSTSVTPLTASGTLHGVLVVAHRVGQASQDDDIAFLRTFAGQAALALERARTQDEREQLVVLEDRERIARDLHDVVIQRLFATGLQLQTAAMLAGRPEVASRINAAIDDLDSTIRDIRAAIFELRTPTSAALGTDVRELVDSAAAGLGFRPAVELTGPLDSAVPDDVRPDLLAVLREALSNVVHHAHASTVHIGVHLTDTGRLRVTVRDDGIGPRRAALRGGLANMRERAARHGGEFAVRHGTDRGTVLEWSVPL